jgi:hypothetical protein
VTKPTLSKAASLSGSDVIINGLLRARITSATVHNFHGKPLVPS